MMKKLSVSKRPLNEKFSKVFLRFRGLLVFLIYQLERLWGFS